MGAAAALDGTESAALVAFAMRLRSAVRRAKRPRNLSPTARAEPLSPIRDLAAACRFSDCRHDTEPGCAVQAAIAAGSLVMTEEDAGDDFSLPTDADPNVEVVEDSATGLMCLVAVRDIRSGEFLALAADDE